MRIGRNLVQLVVVALVAACDKQVSVSSESVEEASSERQLGEALLRACRARDIEKLADLSWEDVEEMRETTRKPDQPLAYSLKQERDQVREADIDRARVFVRSYQDLCEGQLASIVSGVHMVVDFVPEFRKLNPRAVIYWVELDGKYYGIPINMIAKTKSGWRVVNWFDPNSLTLQGGDLALNRANLVRQDLESCDFPDAIEFKSEYVGVEYFGY
jgi:hypothetical protein